MEAVPGLAEMLAEDNNMRVVFVTSELAPYSKSGGLADVRVCVFPFSLLAALRPPPRPDSVFASVSYCQFCNARTALSSCCRSAADRGVTLLRHVL